MNLFFAICWTLILSLDVINASNGHAPTWVSIFCPLAVLTVSSWMDYFKNKDKR